MGPLAEQKVDWDRCMCLKVYHGDNGESARSLGDDGELEPVVYRVDPECPERWKPGHSKIRGLKW